MAVIKCKMCGANMELAPDTTVAECGFCGTNQTVPTADNEKKLALFTRANRLRFSCEFDKAYTLYESIVAEFPEEAESYWGLVLCKYGIEYVDDPATRKKIPTCHRSSFDSIFDDNNFDLALEYADISARGIYREEAKAIENIRRRIIEISSKEEPCDIFICYKETDINGCRTIDSVIAQDVYTLLTENGYRVFFARISLEDKLGAEYEPYIFASLNSAKIMLVFGTDYEHFNAVWVKNEWSRFLQMISDGAKKTLIPCYKDIDAYDMPKEFHKLQAQDMGKVGAMQDLLRGIKKIIAPEKKIISDNASTDSALQLQKLLTRISIFLEDSDWESADEYCEKVLDIDPKNAEAYLGKLLSQLHMHKKEQLVSSPKRLTEYSAFNRAVQYADTTLKYTLLGYDSRIEENISSAEAERRKAEEEMQAQKRLEEIREARQREFAESARRLEEKRRLERQQALDKWRNNRNSPVRFTVKSNINPLSSANGTPFVFKITFADGTWEKVRLSGDSKDRVLVKKFPMGKAKIRLDVYSYTDEECEKNPTASVAEQTVELSPNKQINVTANRPGLFGSQQMTITEEIIPLNANEIFGDIFGNTGKK